MKQFDELPDIKTFMNNHQNHAPKAEALKWLTMMDEFNRNKDNPAFAPDTAGVDYYFVNSFVNYAMEDEFWMAAEEFLKHCYMDIPRYYQMGWGDLDFLDNGSPSELHQYRIVYLMLNAAKAGDEYARSLIKYLYKTFYKREYNQLKRFRTISADEIFSFIDPDGEDITDSETIARILVLCPILGIELEEECGILYLILEKRRKEWLEFEEDEAEKDLQLDPALLKECTEIVDQWLAADRKKKDIDREQAYWEMDKFVENCFSYEGFPKDYLYRCEDNYESTKSFYSQVLALLRTTYPKQEFSFEDVQKYTMVYKLVSTLGSACINSDETGIALLGLRRFIYTGEYKTTIFKPEAVMTNPASAMKKSPGQPTEKTKPITNIAPVGNKNATTEDYLLEIDELRRKLHAQEQEIRSLREENHKTKKALAEAEEFAVKADEDRDELISLREYVYQEAQMQEQYQAPLPEEELQKMQKEIASHSIMLIGGHIGWQNKIKQLFPDWKYINLDYIRTIDSKSVEGNEKVYFFTDYLNHITYKKFVGILREEKIPFGYLESRNVEQMTRQIYNDICG